MSLPSHKTKIVATIGPASDTPEMLERLIRAGLNVARLNFSHGDFSAHAGRIERLRAAEKATGLRVAIMADLPGPKMRVGTIDPEPIDLSFVREWMDANESTGRRAILVAGPSRAHPDGRYRIEFMQV